MYSALAMLQLPHKLVYHHHRLPPFTPLNLLLPLESLPYGNFHLTFPSGLNLPQKHCFKFLFFYAGRKSCAMGMHISTTYLSNSLSEFFS